MTKTTIRASFPVQRRAERRASPAKQTEPAPQRPAGPSRAAQQLALAHYVERAIEAGVVQDYAAAARALGLTRARLTQVLNLQLLAPEIQQRVLMGAFKASEHGLRRVVAEPDWTTQVGSLPAIGK